MASSGQDGLARLWNPDSAVEHRTWITDLAWHPLQPLLASSAFGKVHLWDWQTPDAPSEQSLPHSSPLLNVRWSPDGRYLVCGGQDNSLHCWTWLNAESCQMSGYSAKLRTLAWDRHSRWLATGDREVVTTWDFSQGAPMGQMPRDREVMTDRVLDMAFQSGGDGLAAGDQSGHLMIWKTTDLDFQLCWQGALREGFQRLVWHPHGRGLAAGGVEGAVSVFEIAA